MTVQPETTAIRAKRFAKKYQTEIMAGAVVLLLVKCRALNKDVQRLSEASVIHSDVMSGMIKMTDTIVDRIKPMDVEIGWLREDMSDISRTFDDVFIRLDRIELLKK